MAFEIHLQLKILRTWINIHANSFLGKYHETKMGTVRRKSSVEQKCKPFVRRTLYQGISCTIVFFFFSQT